MSMLDTRNLVTQTNRFELNVTQKDKLKVILLSLLREIVAFCKKHQIQYMLGGGSALGAIRHQGFIPWDDDIDLNMPRNDYMKFIKLFSKEMQHKYDIYVPDGEHSVTHLFMKISLKGTRLHDIHSMNDKYPMGVCIDIFPIENVPANALMCQLKGCLMTFLAYLFVSVKLYQTRNEEAKRLYSNSIKAQIIYNLRLLAGCCLSFKPYGWWYVLFDRWVRTEHTSKLCTVPTGRKHYLGEIIPWNVFLPCSEGIFQNIKVSLPAKPHIYLKNLYGKDYMKLPPENKREHHFYTHIDFGDYPL